MGGIAGDNQIRETAGKQQVNERTVWVWYKEFNWRNRADIRLNARAKKLEEKVDNNVVDRKAKEFADLDDLDKIAIATIKELVKKDSNGNVYINVKIEDAKEMATVMNAIKELKKLKQLLIGEDTERSNVREVYIVSEDGVIEKLKP